MSQEFFTGQDAPEHSSALWRADPSDASVKSASIGQSLREFVEKLGVFLGKALDDTATLEVSTYVSRDIGSVAYEGGKYTGDVQLRALTRINVDGDTLVCVPQDESGEVDAALWQIHLEMVRQAQEGRAELVRTVISAAGSISPLIK